MSSSSQKKVVCVLQPSYQGSSSPIASYDLEHNIDKWLPENYTAEYVLVEKAKTVPTIKKLRHVDVFVNLCDGCWDEDTPGIDVVQTLELLKRPFTGASSNFYDPSKEIMKRICISYAIPTPKFCFAYNDEDIARAAKNLSYPLFVKHYHGGNSVGITNTSRVSNAQELLAEARKFIAEYGGALIEEFVDGREFSVLVASNPNDDKDPIVFEPIECLFHDNVGENGEIINFKTFDFKWKNVQNPWRQFTEDKELAEKMKKMTKDLFVGLNGSGYARSDIRLDKNGNLYMLEINPNCSVLYPDENGAVTADQILIFDKGEEGKKYFLKLLLDHALARHTRNNLMAYEVKYKDEKSAYGLFASRDLKPGDTIYQLEERSHILVSKEHVDKTWDNQNKQFFEDYCYPVTEDLFVMWQPNPEEWKPINHSCDPNSWVTGLDLQARRPIAKGEEITFDYATMYARDLLFECHCGAAKCRKTVKATDFRQPWFEQVYGDHVTDYVIQKRKEIKLHEELENLKARVQELEARLKTNATTTTSP